eukprot:3345115-Rhodomonas_salina.1
MLLRNPDPTSGTDVCYSGTRQLGLGDQRERLFFSPVPELSGVVVDQVPSYGPPETSPEPIAGTDVVYCATTGGHRGVPLPRTDRGWGGMGYG